MGDEGKLYVPEDLVAVYREKVRTVLIHSLAIIYSYFVLESSFDCLHLHCEAVYPS